MTAAVSAAVATAAAETDRGGGGGERVTFVRRDLSSTAHGSHVYSPPDRVFCRNVNVSGCRKNGSMTGTRDALEQLRSALAGALGFDDGIRVVRR